jgi:hypothetical protein
MHDDNSVPSDWQAPFPDDSDFRSYGADDDADEDCPDAVGVSLRPFLWHRVELATRFWRAGIGEPPDAELLDVPRHRYCLRCRRAVAVIQFCSFSKRMTFDAEELGYRGSGRWAANLLKQHECEAW